MLNADPDPINLAGIDGVEGLATGTGSLTTDNTVVTGNIGATFPLPGGFNLFIRYGTSYREPEITVRYLLRNFGSPVFSIPIVPNTQMRAERGKNLDVGVKLDRRRVRASFGYFRNDLTNFVIQAVKSICIPSNPASGLFPTPFPPCVLTGQHAVFMIQRQSREPEVHFKGFEGMIEASIPLGDVGSLTPSVALTWLKSTDDDPAPADILLVEQFFNRPDTPIELEGSAEDIPAGAVVPWTGSVGLRFTDSSNKLWAEYEWRFSSQVKTLQAQYWLANSSNTRYGIFKGLEGYRKHSIRAGYTFGTSKPVRLVVAVENLTDATYFFPFDPAPQPGRQFVFGLTFDWQDVLGD